jgi:diguanylate cyclase (GGDEF)-like protein
MLGLGEAIHTPNQRRFALSVAAVLLCLALLAPITGNVQGPMINAFLPIVATAWALADLMTAFLLLAQFYVNGTRFVAVLSIAYGTSGLLTIPYMLAFPNVWRTGPTPVPDQQVSIWLWILWHWMFPTIVIISVLCDPYLRIRVMSPKWIRNIFRITVATTLGFAAASTATIIAQRAELPQLIHGVHLSVAFNHILAPSIAALNFIGCVLLLRRGRNLTTLHLWLCVAMFAAMLDGALNSGSHSRFTYGWYIGKVLTVATASIVLTVLLSEVTGLYRRLAQMATIDPLTQLFNRRAFEDHLQLVASHAKRHSAGLGLLMLDVDYFKGYNDEYGHAEGDECLRRLATVFRSTATRPLDHVARFGGEEFVVLLPETTPEGAIAVAERIIERVEKAAIPYANSIVGYVTVSVGVGFAVDARELSTASLLELADRALYDAKRRGRNRYTVSIMPADVKEHAGLLIDGKAS